MFLRCVCAGAIMHIMNISHQTSNLTNFISHSVHQEVIRKTCVRSEVRAAVTVKHVII